MTDETKHWFTARKGSMLAEFKPEGILLGIIEVHPDHRPIMHWLGGRDEELRLTAEGMPIVTLPGAFAPINIAVGVSIEAKGQITYMELKP